MPESRTIVLTGATRGLGRALADAFAAAGHTVLGCGRNEEAVADVARALGAPHDLRAVDVADDAAVAAWAQSVIEQHGAPDLLINNAALMNESAPLWEVPAAEFDRLIAVNLGGIASTIRHFVPAMIAAGRGVIVNYSSYWGRSVAADVAPYCATKWGVEGLTKALAQDLPPGLAAVAFNPGIIDTDMLRTCFGEAARSYVTPGDWARTAAPFLLSLGANHNGKSVTAPGQ